ncbi:hypothetical protein HYH03_000400 [Edaphochlamys debaryana]|uniref:Uncharacterized protein n=1 Tax=Edaphochlamys debaryana TaxID=47281 RepID=A0A835YFE1_9CHLO|nr:hypothetical protein HYH03_000400 [Edaphochlamys debaryana]|eukprot:KAG2501902.1 hypothetical protein HYH03_000400 [Edaphochlamys debaryana]
MAWGPMRIAMALPLINFLAQFLLANPDYEATTALLSTLGLISALLLAVVLALPGTVSYDELVAADARFGYPDDTSPTYSAEAAAWWRAHGKKAVEERHSPGFAFGALATVSGWLLTVSLLTVVVQYMYLGCAKSIAERLDPHVFMRLYHKWNRWVFIAVFSSIVIGTGCFFMSMYYMVIVKWPDYAVYGPGKQYGGQVYRPLYLFVIAIPVFVGIAGLFAGLSQYELYAESLKVNNAVADDGGSPKQQPEGKGVDTAAPSIGRSSSGRSEDEGMGKEGLRLRPQLDG